MAMPVVTMPVMAVHETRRSTRRTYKAAGRGADGSPIDKANLSARRLHRNVLCWRDSWLDMEESVVGTSNLIRDPEERGVEFWFSNDLTILDEQRHNPCFVRRVVFGAILQHALQRIFMRLLACPDAEQMGRVHLPFGRPHPHDDGVDGDNFDDDMLALHALHAPSADDILALHAVHAPSTEKSNKNERRMRRESWRAAQNACEPLILLANRLIQLSQEIEGLEQQQEDMCANNDQRSTVVRFSGEHAEDHPEKLLANDDTRHLAQPRCDVRYRPKDALRVVFGAWRLIVRLLQERRKAKLESAGVTVDWRTSPLHTFGTLLGELDAGERIGDPGMVDVKRMVGRLSKARASQRVVESSKIRTGLRSTTPKPTLSSKLDLKLNAGSDASPQRAPLAMTAPPASQSHAYATEEYHAGRAMRLHQHGVAPAVGPHRPQLPARVFHASPPQVAGGILKRVAPTPPPPRPKTTGVASGKAFRVARVVRTPYQHEVPTWVGIGRIA